MRSVCFSIISAFASMLLLTFANVANAQQITSSLNGPWRANTVLQIATAYDSTNTLFLYAADSGTTLIKYDFASEQWNHINTITNPRVVACNIDSPKYVVTNNGHEIWSSTNSGTSWGVKIENYSTLVPRSLVFAPHESDANRVWLGIDSIPGVSTLWKSNDFGNSFAADSYFVNRTSVTSLVFHPTKPNLVWLGGSQYEDGDLKAGVEDPPPPKFRGVWFSTNGGVNWSESGLGGRNVTAMAYYYDPTYGDSVVYAGYGDRPVSGGEAGVKYSTNDGESWQNAYSLPSAVDKIYGITVDKTTGEVYVATNDGVYYSDNLACTSFAREGVHSGLYELNTKSIALIQPEGSDDAFFVGTTTGVFQNIGSQVWEDISRGIGMAGSTTLSVYRDSVVSSNALINSVSQYKNSTWTNYEIEEDITTTVNNTFWHKNGTHRFLCGVSNGNDGVIYESNNGKDWNNKISLNYSSWFNTFALDPKNSQRILCGGRVYDHNNLYQSTDDGVSWSSFTRVPPGENKDIFSLAIDSTNAVNNNSQKIYAGVDAKGLWKTTNNGTDWTQWDLGTTHEDRTVYAVALNPKVPSVVYAGGERYSSTDSTCFWKSTNSGSSWSNMISRSDTVKQILMHPTYPDSSKYLWVIAANGRKIFKTADGGSTWSDVTDTIPTPIYQLVRDPLNDTLIYVSTPKGVYKINPKPEAPKNLQLDTDNPGSSVHPSFRWDASPETDLPSLKYKVFKKRGTIGTWIEKATVSTTNYTDISEELLTDEDPVRIYYYVKVIDNGSNVSGQSNTISFMCNNGISEQKIRTGNLRDLPKEFALSQNYPNPFNPATTIKFALPVDATVSLRIFDVNGKEIATLVNGVKEAGYYEVPFDAKKLSSGVYIYKLTAGNYSATKKMLLMK